MSQAHDGAGDDDSMDVDEDDTKYCICKQVSFGEMIACDNENCKIEWFHYDCVGLSEEPTSTWLCPTCSKLPKRDIKLSKEAMHKAK